METSSVNKFFKMKHQIGWHNKKWNKVEEIKISIKDRGLRFGDGLFETILIREHKAILLKQHLDRLEKSLKILNFNSSINRKLIERIISEGIQRLKINPHEYGAIRINYSRGLNNGRSLELKQKDQFNMNDLWIEFYTFNMNNSSFKALISKKEKRNEFSLISKCKIFNYSQSIQAIIEAKAKNFDDAILLNTKNELCCGTTFNLLLRRNNKWFTPRKESGCLHGIMVHQLLTKKIIEEKFLLPEFKNDDILLAINSLSCRQITQVNDIKFLSKFNTNYFWEILYC